MDGGILLAKFVGNAQSYQWQPWIIAGFLWFVEGKCYQGEGSFCLARVYSEN